MFSSIGGKVNFRAIQGIMPLPFLAVGGLLFLMGPSSPDVVVVATDGYDHSTTTTSSTTTTIPITTTIGITTTVDTTPQTAPTTIERKVTICHLPPGNPPNFQIIEIGFPALEAHLAHGDIFPVPASGICVEPTTQTTLPATTTTVDRCPPELEPCTPGQQTTIPGTTTTLPGTTTSSTSTSTLPGTTTVPGATTTAPPVVDTFDIGAAASVCTNDVPFIELTFGNEPQFNGLVGTITFTTLDGDFIETVPVTYQANTTIRLIFPGASFDPVTGEATDWPGWRLNEDGFWVTDPSDAEFRDGLVVIAELPAPAGTLGQSVRPIFEQVSASTTVSYPPETAACASPEGPFTPGTALPQTPEGQLPATGAQTVGILLLITGVVVGLGNSAIQIGRKRT